MLTHWGRVTLICVVKLTIIGSDNGLSPGRRQAIIWTNAGMMLIGPLGTNFIEISIGIQTFSFKKMHLKMSSAKWRPFCLGLNVLKKVSQGCDSNTMMYPCLGYGRIPWSHSIYVYIYIYMGFNTLRPTQNGRHFPDDILKWIFLNENVWISNKISLKFVPKVPINNIPTLVQIMAWRRSGDKPLSDPMMDSLLTHICVTRPQWVNYTDPAWVSLTNERTFDD